VDYYLILLVVNCFWMLLEFKMKLKNYEQERITKIFVDAYPDRLSTTFSKMDPENRSFYVESDFCVGTYTSGRLLLIWKMEVNVLRIYVECDNKGDIKVMKKTLNECFQQAITILNKNDIKWYDPIATITFEIIPFYGEVKTRSKRVKDIFDQQWEKLILAPLASILTSYLAIQFNILEVGDAVKDIKQALILTIEAYIGLILIIIIQALFKRNKKEFTFKI
jgi:hypothetical protein